MNSGFRLLIYAIAAVLLAWLFITYFGPLFFPPSDPALQIGAALDEAEIALGKARTRNVLFSGGTLIQGSSFDSSLRNVNFMCNSSSICCPKGVSCSASIEWDDRKIKINETRYVKTSARCSEEEGLMLCRVYFGEEPAQVEILSIGSGEEFDLSNGKPEISANLKNAGSQEMPQGAIELRVFQLVSNSGITGEHFMGNVSKTVETGALAAGAEKAIPIELDIEEQGSFKAEVRASGLEAGFDEKIIEFETVGEAASCAASYCETPEMDSGVCMQKCYCTGCAFGTECIQKAGAIAQGQIQGSYALGANSVQFILEELSC
ncbi:MAG: hypothetical protein JW744_01895 [Candidatus Diapherotrites archaeon]|uniref:Uncharacterized protein n=1 Tax=Candidatus Iainarchaeum sp. TaxID=3101447 RepID=A0A938YXL2_9ARCH|nr:hypothetical protein [Candidatus Diapherotrites archaeon]